MKDRPTGRPDTRPGQKQLTTKNEIKKIGTQLRKKKKKKKESCAF